MFSALNGVSINIPLICSFGKTFRVDSLELFCLVKI